MNIVKDMILLFEVKCTFLITCSDLGVFIKWVIYKFEFLDICNDLCTLMTTNINVRTMIHIRT